MNSWEGSSQNVTTLLKEDMTLKHTQIVENTHLEKNQRLLKNDSLLYETVLVGNVLNVAVPRIRKLHRFLLCAVILNTG